MAAQHPLSGDFHRLVGSGEAWPQAGQPRCLRCQQPVEVLRESGVIPGRCGERRESAGQQCYSKKWEGCPPKSKKCWAQEM